MATKERNVLAQILKVWAQEHDFSYLIADADNGDDSIVKTGVNLSWLLKREDSSLNLLELLNRLDAYISNKNKKILDGMYCRKCQCFYHYAEPNQSDGTLLCFSCRSSPFI